jgi:hypothetical protein
MKYCFLHQIKTAFRVYMAEVGCAWLLRVTKKYNTNVLLTPYLAITNTLSNFAEVC